LSLNLYRYKLILRASYGASPEVKLLIFDGLAQRLIGKTTAMLFAEVPEVRRGVFIVFMFLNF